jgi:hypothetical protein
MSAAAARAAATAGAGPETTLRLRTRLVHVERPSIQGVAVQGVNRLVGFRFVGHFHKGKTARAASFTIGHDTGAIDGAVPFKQTAQRFLSRVEVQVADENILHTILLTIESELIGEAKKRDDALRHTRPTKAIQTRSDYTTSRQWRQTGGPRETVRYMTKPGSDPQRSALRVF